MLPRPAPRHQSPDHAQGAARWQPSNASPSGESTRAAEATSSGIEGSARGVQRLSESDPVRSERTISILTFRVERLDAGGAQLSPVPVEMRGNSLTGILNEGDRVRVPETWQVGQTIKPQVVHNLTTGAEVRVADPLPLDWETVARAGAGTVFFVGALLLAFTVMLWSFFFDSLSSPAPFGFSLIPGLFALLPTAALVSLIRAVTKSRKHEPDKGRQ